MQTSQLASMKPGCYGLLMQVRCRHMMRGGRSMGILEGELLEMVIPANSIAVCQGIRV